MIRPLGKNVLITPIADEKVSAGGIHFVTARPDKIARAKVQAIANGVEGVSPGDTILYEAHAPTIEAGNGTRIISVDYIAAVLA